METLCLHRDESASKSSKTASQLLRHVKQRHTHYRQEAEKQPCGCLFFGLPKGEYSRPLLEIWQLQITVIIAKIEDDSALKF